MGVAIRVFVVCITGHAVDRRLDSRCSCPILIFVTGSFLCALDVSLYSVKARALVCPVCVRERAVMGVAIRVFRRLHNRSRCRPSA